MQTNACGDTTVPHPPVLIGWLATFQPYFTAPTWQHVLVLVAGAVLAPGKRTHPGAPGDGRADHVGFARYHEVLNRARWEARAVARKLLLHPLDKLLPSGSVVIGITIERRWGQDQRARHLSRLVRDPTGEHEPAALLSTDLKATTAMILGWFVSRWRVETTFQGVRTHLGVETQRQWSDLAILRTPRALLGLFSLIAVWLMILLAITPRRCGRTLLPGTARTNQHSAMRLPQRDASFGAHRIFPCRESLVKLSKSPPPC
jgi:hypothetical protein